jgi:hypothetical protein
MDFMWYGSIAGIIGATLIGVEILKRALGNVSVVMAVPTWVYAVALASALTYASKSAGLLQDDGNLFELLMQAVMLAASASGFWSWLRQPGDQIGNSEPAQRARFSGN